MIHVYRTAPLTFCLQSIQIPRWLSWSDQPVCRCRPASSATSPVLALSVHPHVIVHLCFGEHLRPTSDFQQSRAFPRCLDEEGYWFFSWFSPTLTESWHLAKGDIQILDFAIEIWRQLHYTTPTSADISVYCINTTPYVHIVLLIILTLQICALVCFIASSSACFGHRKSKRSGFFGATAGGRKRTSQRTYAVSRENTSAKIKREKRQSFMIINRKFVRLLLN